MTWRRHLLMSSTTARRRFGDTGHSSATESARLHQVTLVFSNWLLPHDVTAVALHRTVLFHTVEPRVRSERPDQDRRSAAESAVCTPTFGRDSYHQAYERGPGTL